MAMTQTSTEPRFRVEQLRRVGRRPHHVNVGETERWFSVLGGGALAFFGLTRGSLPGLALAGAGGALVYRGLSGHCHVYGALGVDTSGRGPATVIPARDDVKVEQAMTINRSARDLFDFWSDLDRLPHFMQHLESVRKTGGSRSHWVAKGPAGLRVEWAAEADNKRPNELIAWRSLEGAEVDSTGSVHFRARPTGRGTEVRVILKYEPQAGKAGALLAKLFGKDPESLIREDLRRFKQLTETGEIAT